MEHCDARTVEQSSYHKARRDNVADSKQKRGKADRARVSGSQPSEVYYVAKKFGVSADTVQKVIKRVGNSRKKVYAVLEKA